MIRETYWQHIIDHAMAHPGWCVIGLTALFYCMAHYVSERLAKRTR